MSAVSFRRTALLFAGVLLGLPLVAQAQPVALLTETFDAATPPRLPAGWTSAAGAWATDAGSSGPGSGQNNLRNTGTNPGTAETPTWNFSGVSSGTVAYLARRTGTYEAANLQLTASTDGGQSYPIVVLAAGAALPEASSTYTEITAPLPGAVLGQAQVRFRFEALAKTGGNARIDDFTLSGTGSIPQNTLGFAVPERTLPEGQTPVEVPLVLDFIDPAGLQGLAFTVETDPARVTWIDVQPGPDLQPAADWTLAHHITEGVLSVVLLHNSTSGLKPGAYTPLLTLRATVAPLSGPADETVTLALRNVTGALSKRTGDDAALRADPAMQTWTIERGAPVFFPSDTALDFGVVPAGQTRTLTFDVTNAGGTTDLLITDVAASNPLFEVTPTAAQVAPDDVQTFRISVAPDLDDAGVQDGTLDFAHNADDGPVFALPVTVRVLPAAPGDANQDGTVDLADLMLGVDFTLGRTAPTETQQLALDLHPYPTGNGTLDVRDLTVLVQALSLGQWPDGEPLPTSTLHAAKITTGDAVETTWQIGAEGLHISLTHAVPLRALHLVFAVDGLADARGLRPNLEALEGMSVLTDYQPTTGALSLLLYRLDGEMLAPGTRRLVTLSGALTPEAVSLLRAQAIAAQGQSVEVGVTWKDAGPVPTALSLGRPYPHPFSPTRHQVLSIPAAIDAAASIKVELYDALGRRVHVFKDAPLEPGTHTLTWNGRTQAGSRAAPGLYVLRLTSATTLHHRTVVIQE